MDLFFTIIEVTIVVMLAMLINSKSNINEYKRKMEEITNGNN